MRYKPEIDGLRSVAVLSVLVFHLGFPHMPGGFTGVDIFFVISGYLITDIINKGMLEKRFSIVNFYRRRALRILPPLIVVILAVTLTACYVLLPEEIRNYGRALLWTTLFSSNIFFFKEINYFNPEAKFNPLLHTWSLAVEEQFYIIVPVLFAMIYKFFPKYMKPIFVASVITSFLLSVFLVFISQKTAFYLIPTRYWEMGVGSIIALYGLHQRFSVGASNFVSIVGVGLVLASLLLLNDTIPFPGLSAILPTFGAACIIIAGANCFVGKFLGRPTPVFVGKISYSLYLWHWPIIVFYRLFYAPEITFVPGVIIAAISFVLAYLSYRYVETPLRGLPQGVSDFRVLAVAATCLVAMGTMGLILQRLSNQITSYPSEVLRLAGYDDYDKTQAAKMQYRRDRCFITSGTAGGNNAFDAKTCIADHNDGKPRYLLIGDSQAAHLWEALQESRTDINLMQATASGCKPTLETDGEARCMNLMEKALNEFSTSEKVDAVVLSARWQKTDLPALKETVAKLRNSGISKIIVLGPTVEYSQSVPITLARIIWKGAGSLADFKVSSRHELDEVMAASAKNDQFDYISVYNAVCPDDVCIETVNDVPVQSDYGHFTDSGSRLVAKAIAPQL